jgi:peroxidase
MVDYNGYITGPVIRTAGAPATPDDGYFRPMEGIGNNLANPTWGHTGQVLLRKSGAAYDAATGYSLPDSPNPRVVSNAVCKGATVLSPAGLSNMVWVWAQFIDHALDLTPSQDAGGETLAIPLLADDPNEDHYLPGRVVPFTRSQFVLRNGVREHQNHITSYLDASNVYGSTPDMAIRLRRADGSGKLLTSMADNGEVLPPYNTLGLSMASSTLVPQSTLFAAGDARANENIALLGMHTIWVREHNRLCDDIAARFPAWAGKDELIYQHARRHVIALQQHITLTELMGKLLGGTPPYAGYQQGVDASIATEFSTVGYRVGHTMLPNDLQIGDNPGTTVSLVSAFFNPAWVQAHGVDDVLWGQALSRQMRIDNVVSESVRSMLFGPPTTTQLLDLAALNMQRGRDHGIPGYNAVRRAYGLCPILSWDAFPAEAGVVARLQSVYASPDDVDPWVGGICETHIQGREIGPLLSRIIGDQALRIRAGDRFWWEADVGLSAAEKAAIRATRLSDVLNRNTRAGVVFQPDVFRVPQGLGA